MRFITIGRFSKEFALLIVLLAFKPISYAQFFDDPYPSPASGFDQTQAQPAFSQQELDQMLAPIALYPDQLLSQILMAATYPMEVVEASQWSMSNPQYQGDDAVRAVEQRDWDPSVMSLVAFPQILQTMQRNLNWTERLGDAFLEQGPQMMDTVQNLRQRAYNNGNLRSNNQILVEPQGSTIVVQPANPAIVYVPYYNPVVVYGSWWWPAYPPVSWAPWPGYYAMPGFDPGFAWNIGTPIAAEFFFGDFDWRHRRVNVANYNNYYFNRFAYNERRASRDMNFLPGSWQHDPDHRRGTPYRDARVRQQYGRADSSQPARRDFRGYDQQQIGISVGVTNRRSEVVNPPSLPSRNIDARPDQRRIDPRPMIERDVVRQPNEQRGPQTHPRVPAAGNRPAAVNRPPALEDIGRGADVRNHSSRGRASVEGAVNSRGRTPQQRPAVITPPVKAQAVTPPPANHNAGKPVGKEKNRATENDKKDDNNNHESEGQRKP